jgi:hypothetical protein
MSEADLVPMPRQEARRALATFMSDLSEKCWCAGWLIGNENALWSLMLAGGGRYGQDEVTPAEAASLKVMSDALGEWCVWSDDPQIDYEFVPLAAWRDTVAISP